MRHTGFTSAFQDQLIVAADGNKVRSKIALPTYALHACDAGMRGLFERFSKRERRDAGKPSKSDNLECSASFAPGHVHFRRARRTYLFAARGAHAKRARIHRCEVRLHAIAGSGPRCELLLPV